MKNQFLGFHLDFIGFGMSLLCAVHCATLPFLLSLAPLAGLQFLENPWIEYTIILLSFFIASAALVHGYRKHHQRPLALITVFFGFLLIGSGQVAPFEALEILLTTSGATTVAAAHWINWIHIRQSRVEFPDCLHSGAGKARS